MIYVSDDTLYLAGTDWTNAADYQANIYNLAAFRHVHFKRISNHISNHNNIHKEVNKQTKRIHNKNPTTTVNQHICIYIIHRERERERVLFRHAHFTSKYPVVGTLREYEHWDLGAIHMMIIAIIVIVIIINFNKHTTTNNDNNHDYYDNIHNNSDNTNANTNTNTNTNNNTTNNNDQHTNRNT